MLVGRRCVPGNIWKKKEKKSKCSVEAQPTFGYVAQAAGEAAHTPLMEWDRGYTCRCKQKILIEQQIFEKKKLWLFGLVGYTQRVMIVVDGHAQDCGERAGR